MPELFSAIADPAAARHVAIRCPWCWPAPPRRSDTDCEEATQTNAIGMAILLPEPLYTLWVANDLAGRKAVLVIREEQMETFRLAARRAFEEEMLTHLAGFSPYLVRSAGAESLRRAIRFGIEQAQSHGLTSRGPVRLYLESMLLFGWRFDSDPQYPWARTILAGQAAGAQMEAAKALYDKVVDYRAKVAGPDDTYTLAALARIIPLYHQSFPLPEIDLGSAILNLIEYIYPQKAAYVGRAGLEEMIRSGMLGARRQGFTTPRGAVLVTGLMLMFGHRCGSDPLHPWIQEVLQDQETPEPADRAKRLEAATMVRLEALQAELQKGV